MKTSTLSAYYSSLSKNNTGAAVAETDLNNARLSRDEVLYKAGTGLIDSAAAVKTYVKSLFGATSPQFRQVSGLYFKTVK